MAITQRPGLREVLPGLYASTDLPEVGTLTPEFAAAVEHYSGSKVLRRLIEAAILRQKGGSAAAASARGEDSHSGAG